MDNKDILKIKIANFKLEYENLLAHTKGLINSDLSGGIETIVSDLNAVTDKIRRISKQMEKAGGRNDQPITTTSEPEEVETETETETEKEEVEESGMNLLELYKEVMRNRKK